MDSVTRGADGIWDQGAFEYHSNNATQVRPAPKSAPSPAKLNLNSANSALQYSLNGRRILNSSAGPIVYNEGEASLHFTFNKSKRLTN